MQKFEINVTTKKGEKKVPVYIDNETAAILNECSEEIRLTYLTEEYRSQNRERAETRRHISLEQAVENGHDYESPDDTPLDKLLNMEGKNELEMLLSKLTNRQYKVFTLYVFEGLTFEEIGEKMGTSWQGAQRNFQLAQKKLKKFLEKWL